ncbi:DUF1294 domain-containing protein [Pseudomonas sp. NPDC090202]|uniref:DUF1294 domain-containing protein n=1 Tax=unclassified Pseudomonas TaxID=196821 RepID=UPI00380B5DD6
MTQRPQTKDHKRTASTTVRFVRFKWLVFVLLCALPACGLIMGGWRGGAWLPAAFYALFSVIAFGLYGWDKQQARNEGRRTPEKVLHGAELLGGWPGALLAQQVFRHKTRKLSYQLVFWAIVLLHELFWADRVLLGGRFIARHLY